MDRSLRALYRVSFLRTWHLEDIVGTSATRLLTRAEPGLHLSRWHAV